MRYDDKEVWSKEEKQEHDRTVGELIHTIKASFEQLRDMEEEGQIHGLQDWIEGL